MDQIDEMINKLQNLEKSMPKIAKNIASELDEKFKAIVNDSISNWESDRPSNSMYNPTGNFANVTGEVTAEGTSIYGQVHNNYMSDYPGFPWGYPLDSDTAYRFMFRGGEHGHGKYLRAKTSPSPHDYIEKEVDGKFQKYIEDAAIREIIKYL